jgi:hypothetical protein
VSAEALKNYVGSSTIGGTIAIEGSVSLRDGEPTGGRATVTLDSIAVNGYAVGSGSVEASAADRVLTINGGIGSLDGFLLVENGTYHLDTHEVGGSASLLEVAVRPLWSLLEPLLSDSIAPESFADLMRFDALVSAKGDFSGTSERPISEVDVLIEKVTLDELHLGTITARGKRDDRVWTLSKFDVSGGPIVAALDPTAKNTLDEVGEIHIDGEISKADVSWLSNLSPELEGLAGSLYVPFAVRGLTSSPEIIASLSGRDITYGEYSADFLNIGRISVVDGALTAEGGGLQVRDLEVKLTTAELPFAYPFSFPQDLPVTAVFEIPSRPLTGLSRFFGGLDLNETRGEFRGGIVSVGGTLSDLSVTGEVELIAERLKFDALDTIFTVPSAKLTIGANDQLALTMAASTIGGGRADLTYILDVKSREVLRGSQLSIESMPIRQALTKENRVSGVLSARNILIGGTLSEPIVGGPESEIVVQNGRLVIREEFAAADEAVDLPISPRFDIPLIRILESGIESGLLQARFAGSGYARGSLSDPNARVEFEVREGTIKLPTAQLRMAGREESDTGASNTATFSYGRDVAGDVTPSLTLNSVAASTYVSAFNGINYERYKIILNISGDVLGEDELDIVASSDPYGLSQNQIFSILGQQQLFETLSGALTSGDFQSQLKGALTMAAPSLLSPLTRSLERGLGLDYIFIDFSQSGTGVAILGKSLGSGFSIEYRRPLTEATDPRAIELIQLTYRPAFRRGAFSRFGLSFGYDGYGIWRASLSYSSRF